MNKLKKVVLVSGGYDPCHRGHIEYFKHASKLGERLIVALNSDEWLIRKKGSAFMPFEERLSIISNLKMVDECISFDDSDGSACDAINQVLEKYPKRSVIFANGGDRTSANIPEMRITDPRLQFAFGVGGDTKKNSSSWILQEWKAPKTIRPWGYYRVLHTVGSGVKLKELTVDPGCLLSMQRHQHRSELWFVAEGTAGINSENDSRVLQLYQQNTILPLEWHQLHNPTHKPLRIIEIQYGTRCEEEDIERKEK